MAEHLPKRVQVQCELAAVVFPQVTTNRYEEKALKRYTLHYRNLQLYVQLGLIVERMHRVLQFLQENWMKDEAIYQTKHSKKSDREEQIGREFVQIYEQQRLW